MASFDQAPLGDQSHIAEKGLGYKQVPELNWRLPTGVAMLSQTQFRLPWERVKYFHANKESNDDYKSFLYEVEDVMTSSMLDVVLQEVLSQNRRIMKWHARQEAEQLQDYYFRVYLESCDFIKYDSNPNQILEDDRLDMQSFPALSQKDMLRLIGQHLYLLPPIPPLPLCAIASNTELKWDKQLQNDAIQGKVLKLTRRSHGGRAPSSFQGRFHIDRLMKLEYIHEYFACWKSLAKCEFIKFDSDLSGIFNRIKCEGKWPEGSDKMLKVTLAEHLKLLCQLTNHNKATGGPMLDSKVPELFSTDLEEAIDGKYQAAILAFNKKDSQCFDSEHVLLKYQQSPKIQPMALLLKKLSELDYGSKPLSMYPLLSGLKDLPRGKAFPTYIRGLPVLMFGVALAGLGMGREKMSR
ncbi:hypothetical protein RHMOL_Rhmol10G0307400 [Rhododendron molle]|uniref:Uncharacterized protein n=3 Tax=Rhododendron molle TaxID=49168 RepID=A0ACC0M7S2_RHOML|nr:hypothetical protein RHMOL_Rhmol10G0307400 [Rhododendron molle]KAI8537086.1 hypothetical protein RHMOL_Rhmol10G0307400 [Rhododendron molle]KAI8537087.1 hypothetical protein RHMOL_Rhmol10G0307400 [Rhododendron molle]